MAGSSLLALIDDIASVLDDISVMTKVAAKNTVGALGDDLALNAQQVAGVRAERELPVVWAVAKGSLVNKAILVPGALGISAVAPWAIVPLLMVGGAYLSFEAFEKLAHRWLRAAGEDAAHQAELARALQDADADLVAVERDKIKGAVRTDFILSAEIIVIALATVAAAPFAEQVAVLVAIALIMTVGVYGLVAGIVKLDDAGLYLSRLTGEGAWAQATRGLGRLLVSAAPRLMQTLSVVGTAAMFLVGGGIIRHGVPAVHHLSEWITHAAGSVAIIGGVLEFLMPLLLDALVGILTGALVLAAVTLGAKVWVVLRRWGGT
ncbi:DUF808 domain-containing protein [uncultured Thiodictyon sp.]|uniref:DUF808 domain-containing protein n=1 Tax=uncultured Thiodictyon sp. TaxID=1846217 RepID=UPI0025D7D872|nr:DUF808 domain-containing protein [uncultured Thiodictyon sp.]